MGRGSPHALVQLGRARRWAAHALAAVACSGCALAGPSTRVDRAFATAPPAAWSRIAVLPFEGAPELCRPAEELLAVRIRQQDRIAVMPPFTARRGLSARAAAGGEAPSPSPSAWIGDRADAETPLAPAASPSADQIRAVAARLGVDGVVAGAVTYDQTWRVPYVGARGAAVEVVLFDSAGAPVAVLRRRGGWEAARNSVHEAAMEATGRVADDLLIVLRTPPGQAPAVSASPEPTAAE